MQPGCSRGVAEIRWPKKARDAGCTQAQPRHSRDPGDCRAPFPEFPGPFPDPSRTLPGPFPDPSRQAAEADELEGGAGKGEAFAALGWRTVEAWGAAAGGSQDGGSNLGSRAASGLFSLPSKLGLSRSNSRTNLADGGQPAGSSASLHKRPTSFFLSRANTFLSFKPKQRDAVAVASVIAEGGTAASLSDELRAEVWSREAAGGKTSRTLLGPFSDPSPTGGPRRARQDCQNKKADGPTNLLLLTE